MSVVALSRKAPLENQILQRGAVMGAEALPADGCPPFFEPGRERRRVAHSPNGAALRFVKQRPHGILYVGMSFCPRRASEAGFVTCKLSQKTPRGVERSVDSLGHPCEINTCWAPTLTTTTVCGTPVGLPASNLTEAISKTPVGQLVRLSGPRAPGLREKP